LLVNDAQMTHSPTGDQEVADARIGAVRPRLAFISPLFLFPADAGGKIRTGNILRGLKGGAFDITLVSPAKPDQQSRWLGELAQLCDHFVAWEPSPQRARWQRVGQLLDRLPVNVAQDRSQAALDKVAQVLQGQDFDLVVFDFVHAAVLRPAGLKARTVCFTHNVEAEIFARHAQTAGNPVLRALWRSQHRKMAQFEQNALSGFDTVIAVSDRDASFFRQSYGLERVAGIPTGVDLDFFAWQQPQAAPPCAVFTGSMDWEANVDGVGFFLDQVWPLVLAQLPEARFVVVGRRPPAHLVEKGKALPGVSFTGFVDDVRPYAHAAQAFVIPLRVGGGTRIKAFEAMAMGCPVVSTTIGIEGLDVTAGEHYLLADSAADQASAVLRLLLDATLRERLSAAARTCVEQRFGHRVASDAFERICLEAFGGAGRVSL
jgi:polysaccharide biosynthesis protein PslH